MQAPSASTCCSASASEPPPPDCNEEWGWLSCERAVEDWCDPVEEVFAPVSSIGAGSTALMLMLIGCTGSLVADGEGSGEGVLRLGSGFTRTMFVRSIWFTLLVELRLARKSLTQYRIFTYAKPRQVKTLLYAHPFGMGIIISAASVCVPFPKLQDLASRQHCLPVPYLQWQ